MPNCSATKSRRSTCTSLSQALVDRRQRSEEGRRHHQAVVRRRRTRPLQGAGSRFPARPGDHQSDRQCALILAAGRRRARHLPAAATRRSRSSSMMTGRACGLRRWRRSSSASTPTGRSKASARTPASACRFRSRSSKRMAAASGSRTAPRAGGDGAAARARRPLHRAPAGDVTTSPTDPRHRRSGRRQGGADPRRAGQRQVAAGAAAARSGRAENCRSCGWSATTASILRAGPAVCWCGRRRSSPGCWRYAGLGIVRVPFEPVAVVGLVVDLGQPADRLPAAESRKAVLEGVTLPRLAVPARRRPPAPSHRGRFGPFRPHLTASRQCATPLPRGWEKVTITGLDGLMARPVDALPSPSYRSATSSLYGHKVPCARVFDGDDVRPFVRRKTRAREEFVMIGLVLVTHGQPGDGVSLGAGARGRSAEANRSGDDRP